MVDADEQSSAREVVVGLQDGSLPIHYIHTEPSLTRQRNIGIDRAGGDVVVFLDDDVSLPSDLFAKLERTSPIRRLPGRPAGWSSHTGSGVAGRARGPVESLCPGVGATGAASPATATHATSCPATGRVTSSSCRAAS